MEKKNTIIGVLLLVAAFYFMYDSNVKNAEYQRANQTVVQTQTVNASVNTQGVVESTFATTASKTDINIPEEIITISNDSLSVNFTNKGGAIANAEILKYPLERNSDKPFVFNMLGSSVPAMGLGFYDASSALPKPFLKSFNLVAKSADTVSYEFVDENLKITRTYALIKDDKQDYTHYTIATKTSIQNLSNKPLPLEEIYLSLGSVPPTASDVYGSNLSFLLYDGDDAEFIQSRSFIDSNGLWGIGASQAKPFEKLAMPNSTWGSVKNQFFASVFTPENITANSGIAYPLAADDKNAEKYMKNGIAGFMGFYVGNLEAGKTWDIAGTYYLGPKQLDNLASLGAGQEEVMHYGWFGFVSRPLSRLLDWINSGLEVISPDWSWGWSIIILTLIVRLLLWPLTSVQIKSAQRMSKMQEPLKAIKEQFKDDPNRIQQETMKLYSEYGINPLAGCLPILIQIPIFIGLYYMLQTSCEIRFAQFLWIKDLAMPDTIDSIPSILGVPLHILPLLNALVSFIQMQLTPTPSADKTQATLMKLMPVIMLFFFYSFPSGLVLYWLVQSLLGIVQALIVRRGKDKVVLKKRTGPSFMQKIQMAAEQAQAAQAQNGGKKLSFKEQLQAAKADALKAKQQKKAKDSSNEVRKKNPGGRSTPKKR